VPGLDAGALHEVLPRCLAVPRWVAQVAATAPYRSVEDLEVRASNAALRFSDDELDQALTAEGRIEERLAESPAPGHRTDQATGSALLAGSREYEQKFGRIFFTRIAGRSPADVLAELDRRLRLDPDSDRAALASELHDIALLRLRSLVSPPPR
jgi:2-oxo-4-hydroxy-4-carboxy-5-ureidoimidazoline decarboxylase